MMGEEHKPRVEAGELPGEADAAEDAEVEALAATHGPGVLIKDGRDLVALAKDYGEKPGDWYRLACEVGAKKATDALNGGRLSREGLDLMLRAVDARRARAAADRSWLDVGSYGVPTERKRVPLFKLAGKPWLPGGVVGLVVAKGGTGKTTWLAELAVRVAYADLVPEGAPPAFPAIGLAKMGDGRPAKAPVMVLLAEEDAEGMETALWRALVRVLGEAGAAEVRKAGAEDWRRRVYALGGADHSTALGTLADVGGEIVPSALHDALCEHARKTGPLLIVLDPINQLLPAGTTENDATSAAALMMLAGRLRAAAEEGVRKRQGKAEGERLDGPRPVVLLAHHERKAEGGGDVEWDGDPYAARGSSAFVDNARWVLRMQRARRGKAAEVAVFQVVKSNYTAKGGREEAVINVDANGVTLRAVTDDDREAWAAEETKAADAKKAKAAAAKGGGAAKKPVDLADLGVGR